MKITKREIRQNSKVIAIGETGLDFDCLKFMEDETKRISVTERQEIWFNRLLEVLFLGHMIFYN